MARFRTPLYFLLAGLLMAVPSMTFAAGFLGPVIPQSGSCFCDGGPLDWGCVLDVIQNLVRLAVSLGVIMCVVWLAYAGFSLIASRGNPESISTARARILNSLIGIAVILCSWLVVDFVMKALYNPAATFDGSNIGPWNAILAGTGSDQCIKATNPISITAGQITSQLQSIVPGLGTAGPTSGNGGGSCSVLPSGACSVSALQGTCFSNRVQQAAQICNLESAGGNPSIESGSDKLNSGSGPSYSIGLWQINLTTSPLTANGQACTTAFTGSCGSGNGSLISGHPGWCTQSIRPGKQDLYNACKAAAQNPQTNTQIACTLYRGGTFQPWTYSANRCGVPLR